MIAYFHCIGHTNQRLKYFSDREKRYTDNHGVSSIDNAKLEEIRKNYPIKEFLSISSEISVLDSIHPFILIAYQNDKETFSLLLNDKLKYIKTQLRPPTEVAVGFLIQKNKRFIALNRKEVTGIYTPLDSKRKALALLCLLEKSIPIYDLSFLDEEVKEGEEPSYCNIKAGLQPTHTL